MHKMYMKIVNYNKNIYYYIRAFLNKNKLNLIIISFFFKKNL